MATKQKPIFTRSKPLMSIYSGVDRDGKEVEVREDAEQLVKWHEISDALVSAGYYRAQLQGLSTFDKIVGGLTWCIELCDIDVDVNLLFEENLTIGKKIALTEKIVKILPSMKCPYIIEPHQIQGLDFINIYPLVQWLIKYSSEFREVKEDELRRFAVKQYEKDHIFEIDRTVFAHKAKVLKNLCAVQNLYKPCRVRKRKGCLSGNELEQVNATLSEYDQRMLMRISAGNSESKKDEELDFLYDYEKTLADPSNITTETDRYIKDQTGIDDSSDTKLHYAVLHSELTGGVSKELEESEILRLSEEATKLTNTIDGMTVEIEGLKSVHVRRMEESKENYANVVNQLRKITNKLKTDQSSKKSAKDIYKSLKELARERAELLLIIQNREDQHKKLKEELSVSEENSNSVSEEPLTADEMKEYNERQSKLNAFISNVRLELGKMNREVLRYSVAIDEVPGPAELLQYEKRFIELYNQVASKHKETKQYYIFYNTLYEVKTYTSKELGLLNSILDNYEEAMSSGRKRAEFMSQLEGIVEWVNQTVRKVEEKAAQERSRAAALHAELARLLDLQRQYCAALRSLAHHKHNVLLSPK